MNWIANIREVSSPAANYARVIHDSGDDLELRQWGLAGLAFTIAKDVVRDQTATLHPRVATTINGTIADVVVVVRGWYVQIRCDVARGTGHVIEDECAPSARRSA